MKMYQLYNAYFDDRSAAYEKPLDWIYQNCGTRCVEIRPTIWLWRASNAQVYFVDYIGDGVSCTLQTFARLNDAEKYREEIAAMEESDFENWLINEKWNQNTSATH